MTIKHSPGQLVFNQDLITRANYTVDWNKITNEPKRTSDKSNARENKTRLNHKYNILDDVLIFKSPNERRESREMGDPIIEGPYHITKIYNNGTIDIRRRPIIEKISVRRVKPFTRRSLRLT